MSEPAIEPPEANGRPVPQQAASPEPATGAQGPGATRKAAQSAGPVSAGPVSAGTDLPAAAATALPAESIVLVESLTGSGAGSHVAAAARAMTRRVSDVARGTATLASRYKLETVAVLLLGVGGAVWPPVWVLGVLVALPSRIWDLRDKWTGLVAPVLLVIASTVLILAVGGRHGSIGSYAFEAWLAAGRVSRVAAALGAGYLFWRLRRGRREPKQPPWNVPHRLG